MLNIALLHKAETCAIGLASNALHLAKNFLMFAILTKTVFCPQFLLLERPPFSYMNGDPLFLFLVFADHMYIHNIS